MTNNYVLPDTYTPVPQLTVYAVQCACAIATFTSREYYCVDVYKINQLLWHLSRTIPE
jgi:hypothetical protein